MEKFLLHMLTPERTFWEGEAVSVTVTDEEGWREILAHHAPLVVSLRASTIRIDDGKESRFCANGEGFLTVEKGVVHIVCQTFEWPEEIDENKVKRAVQEHEESLKMSQDAYQRLYHAMSLRRAYARMNLLALLNERKNKI